MVNSELSRAGESTGVAVWGTSPAQYLVWQCYAYSQNN